MSADHIFSRWWHPRFLTGDTAVILFYIITELLLAGMFALMAVGEGTELTLWGCCCGFALIALLLALVLHEQFDAFINETTIQFKAPYRPPHARAAHLRSQDVAYSLMPRLDLQTLYS